MRTAQALLSGWVLEPLPAIVLIAVALCYVTATVAVDRRQPFQPWPGRHTLCFLSGIVLLWVAILGPPGAFDDVFFYAHMTQHILLTAVAAPLLSLGDPVLLSLRVASRGTRRRWLVPVYRSRAVEFMSHPMLGWGVFVVVMVLSHVPRVYDYALNHPFVHDYVEHPLYLAIALLYFYPLLADTPSRRRIAPAVRALSVFSMMMPMSILGFFIYAAPHLVYPFYASVTRPFGPGPLPDQQLGGALMWSTSMILSVVWFALTGLRWLQAEERRSHRIDRAVARSMSARPKPPHPELPT